jgi:hypothetical protein
MANMVQPDDVRPGAHPEPPVDIAGLSPILRRYTEPLFRIHRRERDALHFGRSAANRFDSPDGKFGVLYAATDPFGAFIEVFEIPNRLRPLDESAITARSLATLRCTRPLTLIDLTAEGLARIGADARLTTGDQLVSRRWARALHPLHVETDGILYRARHDPSRLSVALFDRAVMSISVESSNNLLSTGVVSLTIQIIEHYGYAVTPE